MTTLQILLAIEHFLKYNEIVLGPKSILKNIKTESRILIKYFKSILSVSKTKAKALVWKIHQDHLGEDRVNLIHHRADM